MNIEVNGKTIYISSYEYYFVLKDEDVDAFYQSCIADDLGTYRENPFCNFAAKGNVEIEEDNIED